MVLRKSFYIRWSAGRSPRVHEVNPGWDPSNKVSLEIFGSILSIHIMILAIWDHSKAKNRKTQ